MKKIFSASLILTSILLAQDVNQKQIGEFENTPPPPLANF